MGSMDDDPKTVLIGYILHELCEKNGKIKYGTWDTKMYNPPLRFNPDSARSKNSVSFTV
jgi:hypothetical protein